MKNHKFELTIAGILLLIYLVMIGGYNFFETNLVYDEITGLLLIGCVGLVIRVSWVEHKESLKE